MPLRPATLVLLLVLPACIGRHGNDPCNYQDDPHACDEVRDVAVGPEADVYDEVAPAPFESPRFLTDELGGVLILHGANVSGSAKGDPQRVAQIDASDVARLAGWGFDFARFLILWDGLEPQPGQIDQAYLDRIEERVDLLWSGGIHVMLDLHQDLWSIRFGGDGAPDWAIRDDGLPFEGQDQWFENYLQPAVKRCFDNFWAYDQGAHADLQEHYVAAWQAVAARFRDHPGVLGYDVMNEPHPGSDMDPIELLGLRPNPEGPHARFDRDEFGPFYQRVINGMRQVDPDKWVFVEPRYGAPGLGMPSYLGPLTDPRPGAARIAWAPHLYSLSAEATGVYAPDDPVVALWETERRAELARQPMPLLIGEFGFNHGTVDAERYLNDVLQMADRNLAGWAWWSYDCGGWGFWECDGTEKPLTAMAVRAYPRRVAGEPQGFSYDATTRVLELRFTSRADVGGDTVVVAPERLYPDGPAVTLDDQPAPDASWDRARGLLTLTLAPNDAAHVLRVGPASGAR